MALAPSDFKENAVGSVAQVYELSIDLEETGEFETLCFTNCEETFNEDVQTWTESCGNGVSSSAPGTQDYEIAWEAVQRKGSLVNDIYKLKHDVQGRIGIPIRLDNTLMDVRTEFIGMITLDSAGGDTEDFAPISGTMKVSEGKINVITPIPTM